MEFYEKLYQAIKNDDIHEFKDCMDTNYCGSLRLGRFPVLSVMYLYNSRKLIRTYEKKFLKHNSWQDVGEPSEIVSKFRGVAGKCLRLYLNETVSPLEMLLLLDRNDKLRQVYKNAHITVPAKQRLKDIYYIRWGLQADFVRGKIVLEHRPLTRREKWTWVFRVVCVVLCLAIFSTTPFVVNAFAPFIADEAGQLHVSRWGQIDFSSKKVYALDKDITVPEDFYLKEMNCDLRGNGHKITVKGDVVFGDVNGSWSGVTVETNGATFATNLNGKLTDVVFETDGSPVIENIQQKSEIDGVTVNAAVDRETSKAIGFLAINNYSTKVTNVSVNASGTLTVKAEEQSDNGAAPSFNCGGIVANNKMSTNAAGHYYGYLESCSANYTDFNLKGDLSADASFGGLVGKNEGIIENAQTNGNISADTFDVAGICAENYYWVVKSTNNVDIHQSSDVVGWNPLASGVVLLNYFVVDQCVNRGDITSVSTISSTSSTGTPCAYAAGIAYENFDNYIQYCENYGKISASATAIDADASGICSFSNGHVSFCVNNGDVSATGSKVIQVAGITTLSYGYVYACANNGKIVAKSDSYAYVGGIVASSCFGVMRELVYEKETVVVYSGTEACVSNGSIEVDANVAFVGGILGRAMLLVGAHGATCGYVIDCVATCDVTVKKGTQLDIGGIVGFAEEKYDGQFYTLATIRGCYFVGKFDTPSNANLGAIAGVVGEKTYNASNSATSDVKKNFFDNYYSIESGVSRAFGAALDSNSLCIPVADIGATAKALQQILSDANYIDIVKNATSESHSHE